MGLSTHLRFLPECLVPSYGYCEITKKVVPTKQGSDTVVLESTPCEKLSDKVLNPVEVTLTSLLKSNTLIDPKGFTNALGITDVADIEKLKMSRAKVLVNYVKEHENELLDLVKNPQK